jgi:hypothetical protein
VRNDAPDVFVAAIVYDGPFSRVPNDILQDETFDLALGNIDYVCVAAGCPGTWKGYGAATS